VTDTQAAPAPEYAGLLAKLMAAVRPEFRVDVLIPGSDDVVLGMGVCKVAGCPRALHAAGMCVGHFNRWKRQGRPELERFVATTNPQLVGRTTPRTCEVSGCRQGRHGKGLCPQHEAAWRRAGQPELQAWLATTTAGPDQDRPICRLSFCDLQVTGFSPFCRSHLARWYHNGRPDVEAFAQRLDHYGYARVEFGRLRGQLKLELQYVVQRRCDERRCQTDTVLVMKIIRIVARSGVASLLDWPAETWRRYVAEQSNRGPGSATSEEAFLAFAVDQLEELVHGSGWAAWYPRDVWDLRRLGFTEGLRRLRFDRIPQPWLKELAKRWVRYRLSSGLSSVQVGKDLAAITSLGQFLAATSPVVDSLAQVDRAVLERYLADLAVRFAGRKTHGDRIGSLNQFFRGIRQHRWDDTLPGNAMFFPEDHPKRPKQLPRYLAELVMTQVERPDNLDRFADPAVRLVTLILIRCGLRIGDACRLALDAVVHDADGAPYLRYFNRKMKREALVPIDEELEQQIAEQHRLVLARWPDGSPWLFPQRRTNRGGHRPLPTTTYRGMLRRWLATCEIHDSEGQPVHLTPHQWRHTFATRLVNNDVPLEVVRVLLDHESLEMSGHYARLRDETVRRHWEKARKVNCKGEDVKIEPESPLADAQWVKHRVGLAKQALPNGYCGLPIQKRCPHANACHVCPVFVTTPEFLPQHREHREQTHRLLDTARANGQLRMVEMNQQVLGNLDRIITKLEADQDPQASLGEAADAG